MGNINYTSSPEYQARLRDQEKIDKILSRYDKDNPADVDKICQMLNLGTIKFESKVGNDFDDEMFELRDRLKSQKSTDKTSVKNRDRGKTTGKQSGKSSSKTKFEDLDDDMKVLVRKELKAQYIKRTILIVVLALVSISCIGYFAIFYFNDDRGEKRYRELAELKGSEALDNGQTEYIATITDDGIVVPDVLPEYKTLYNSNKNLIGWIKIDDTIIDYPVMQ